MIARHCVVVREAHPVKPSQTVLTSLFISTDMKKNIYILFNNFPPFMTLHQVTFICLVTLFFLEIKEEMDAKDRKSDL